MGNKRQLTAKEKGTIFALKGEGLRNRALSKRIKRNDNVIYRFLKDQEGYRNNRSTGNNQKMAPAATRALLKSASNTRAPASQLKRDFNFSVVNRRIQQIIY